MTPADRDALWERNAIETNKMKEAAASMVESLMSEIEENGPAYIELSNAAPKGHTVDYVIVEDNAPKPNVVKRVGKSLGLTITDTTIEVPHD
jgi:hypothetical protein